MPRRRPVRLLVLAALLGLAALLPACGGEGGSSTPRVACALAAGGHQFTLQAKNVRWDVGCISMPAPGPLRITMHSVDQAAHNVHVTGHGVDAKTELQAGPVTQHLTVDLPVKGEYTFICDLHELQMKGVIQVG
jgi:hypothetical protein